jgi:hypothetical protein
VCRSAFLGAVLEAALSYVKKTSEKIPCEYPAHVVGVRPLGFANAAESSTQVPVDEFGCTLGRVQHQAGGAKLTPSVDRMVQELAPKALALMVGVDGELLNDGHVGPLVPGRSLTVARQHESDRSERLRLAHDPTLTTNPGALPSHSLVLRRGEEVQTLFKQWTVGEVQ